MNSIVLICLNPPTCGSFSIVNTTYLYYLFVVLIVLYMHVCSVISDSATLRTVARQAPLSMGFSRQEYWSGLPFPLPEDLPDPGMELVSPELQASSILLNHAGSLFLLFYISTDFCCYG